jgi:hypothetical protein
LIRRWHVVVAVSVVGSATITGYTRETDRDASARNATGRTIVVEQIGSDDSIGYYKVLPPAGEMLLPLSFNCQKDANFQARYPNGPVIGSKHRLCVTDTWVIRAR